MKELSKIKKQEEVVKNKIKDIDYLSNEETEKKTEITLLTKAQVCKNVYGIRFAEYCL